MGEDFMDEIILVEPSSEYAEDLWAFRREIIEKDADDENQFAGCMSLNSCNSADEWIRICTLRKDEKTCEEVGTEVPSHTYLAIRKRDNRIVGVIDLRHHIDHPILGTWGGHCGYSVRPSERGHGYAKEMLRLNKLKAGELGIDKMLVTCDEGNPASEKTIIANGGVFEKTIDVDGDKMKRFWINIKGAHKNFLFDLDQTLLDFNASERIALEIVLKTGGLSFSEEIYNAFKDYNKALWGELEKGTISRTELFVKRFNYIFGKCEGDSSGLDPLKINAEFIRTMSENGVLLNGSLELVKKIKTEIKDSRIFVITNGATINAKGRIETTGLDRYIDGIFVSEDMGVNKPSAEYFDMVLAEIGEIRENCIVIGDSLTSDMLGAKNAGMNSVWFMPGGDIESAMKEYDIDYCASSFDELYEILKQWSRVAGLVTH